jgi:hypothetical protein
MIPTGGFEVDLSSPSGIAKALTSAANHLLQGHLDTKIANAVGYLCDCALRAHAAGSVAIRLAALERLQEAEKPWAPAKTNAAVVFEATVEDPADGRAPATVPFS